MHFSRNVCLFFLTLASGCGGPPSGTPASAPPPSPTSAGDQALYQELETKINTIISEHLLKYGELRYEYSEGLLKILDQIELTLSGKVAGGPPRFLAKLDPGDEREHFRETVRRWEKQTGKALRAEVDRFKADVAARPAGPSFHPEFQRKFAQAFDLFTAIEVGELRERRNRAIHAAAETILSPRRSENPEPVRRIERLLNTPPYDLAEPAGTPAAGPKP